MPWRFFGRRPSGRVVRSPLPASENLVWGLSVSRKKSPCVESFCHITRLRCGTATLLLGCAERSKPRSRVRRAEGAGLDRECADRVTIIVAATYKPFLVCGFSFHRRESSRNLSIQSDMIRGELAIGRGNRATALYSVDPEDRRHDAVMRIGGEAPGRRVHSAQRLGSHGFYVGSPPPRMSSAARDMGRQAVCPGILPFRCCRL